jgi:hypothetical protein
VPSVVPLNTSRFRWAFVAILLLAGLWRGTMALLLPVIARDGVTFCWYARDLGTGGLAYLQRERTRQHPLYPAAILATHGLARTLGARDGPLTWQHCAQLVSWLAGMVVVALVGAVTVRLVRRLHLPLDERLAALAAMLWTALLDLHVWLSADAMSDEVHLALYLGAVFLLLKLDTLPAALGCGILSGLAFLTRPEGALPALGGLVTLLAHRRELRLRKLARPAVVLTCGFLLCAAPYWCVVGRLSAKKNLFQPKASSVCPPRPTANADAVSYLTSSPGGCRYMVQAGLLAKLERLDVPWYALLPQALYKLFRAGRLLIPLLALPALWSLRKQLTGTVLAGWTTCLAGHLGLTLVLLSRYGYLDPRHMLVPIALLTPLAAMFLARGLSLLLDLRSFGLAGAIAGVCFLPPAVYALRVPNGPDRYLADAARWLVAHDPAVASKRLLAGSSPQRLAFYADMRWEPWAEKPEEYAALVRQIRNGGPGYLALEIGPGYERQGNRELAEKLLHDGHLAAYLGPVEVRPGPGPESELRLIELRSPP